MNNTKQSGMDNRSENKIESRDYLEMAFRSVECFANDGKLDVDELEKLVAIALRDGQLDENEKRVLKQIFDRLHARDLTPEMLEKINHLCFLYGIDRG